MGDRGDGGTLTTCTCLLRVQYNLSHSNVCTNRIGHPSGKLVVLYPMIFKRSKMAAVPSLKQYTLHRRSGHC
jgi:hypothetical protein